MAISIELVLSAVVIGVGATVTMDLWALLLQRVSGAAPPNFCLVGRWFCHMSAGRFFHSDITKASAKSGECAVGWLSHYLIGITYAIALICVTSGAWLNRPSVLPALAVGTATLIFPFFIMQPAFGLGIAAARAANPTQARLRSVMAHLAFGCGLYISAVAVNRWIIPTL